MKMFCKKCGAEISEDMNFCKQCGAPLSPGNSENKEVEKKKKKKKHIVRNIFLTSILLLVFYCALAYFFHLGIWVPEKQEEEERPIVENWEEGTVYELDEKNVVYDEEVDINYVNNIIVVFFEEGTSEKQKNELVDSIDGVVVGSLPSIDQYQVEVQEKTLEELETLCSELEKSDIVRNALVDVAFRLDEDVIPEDPWKKFLFFGEKWSEDNPGGSNWWQEAINAPSAWEYKDFFEPINIGVIDNGFDIDHEDLNGVIKSISSNSEPSGHGTHVAGIIGAKANNKCGITGIVWDANLYTTDWELTKTQKKEEQYQSWETSAQILSGVQHLITSYGAKVINLSAGQTGSMKTTERSEEDVNKQGEMASGYLVSLLDRGYDFVIVQSAGNGNKDNRSVDAVYNGLFCSISEENCVTSAKTSAEDILDRIIVVAAAQNEGGNVYTQTKWSNAGHRVDICAPGEDIYSTVVGGYKALSGTSMAAPIVTGVASLVWSVDPAMTGSEVKNIVCSPDNTKYVVEDNVSRKHALSNEYPMVNAELAVKAAIEMKEEKAEGGEKEEKPIGTKEELEADPIHFNGMVIKPEDVVLKLFDSLQKGDYEEVAECWSPVVEEQADFWGEMVSAFTSAFAGEYVSWGDLALEAIGTMDVEVIACNAYNLEYDSGINIVAPILDQIPSMKALFCREGDVYVKYRYKHDGTYYTSEEKYHVKRYEWSGWRITGMR